MSKERGPRPKHKYISRTLINGSWVYLYDQPPSGPPKRRGRPPKQPPSSTSPSPAPPSHSPRPLSGHDETIERLRAAVRTATAQGQSPQDAGAAAQTAREAVATLLTGRAEHAPKPGDASPPSKASTANFSGTKAPGTKEDLLKQVSVIAKWTGKSLLADTARFTKETGFKLTATEPGKRPSPNRVAVTRSTATCLLALRHLVNVLPGMTDLLSVEVKASGKNTLATYVSETGFRTPFGIRDRQAAHRISVHDSDTGQSVVHEFGHFLDHYLGDPSKASSFSSEKLGSPMADFVNQIKTTDSYKSWLGQIKVIHNSYLMTASSRHLARIQRWENKKFKYTHNRREMVARFFDYWAHHQLGKRGFNTNLLGTKPDYKIGTFSDADIEKLTPAFEAALGDKLKKSILNALRDLSWMAKQRTCSGLL